MKRKRLILGGLIFVLLFSVLPILTSMAADDTNMDGSWNGKHGTPQEGWTWDGDYGVRVSVVDSEGNLKQGPADFIQDAEAGNTVTAWFANGASAPPDVKKISFNTKTVERLHLEKRIS